ncbi:MAG: trimethylamine methyltransferase family protein [Spirochaetota bacterium]|nr:MAG: trimethylamine methyltransferase family protein [Spirochaetota bacterium]
MNIDLTILASDEIEKMHKASIKLLESLGVYLPHEETLKKFEKAGARVDKDKKLVWIPEQLVSESLEACGKRFTIYGRDHSKKAEFGVGKRNYQSIGGNAFWIDDNLERRFAILEDVTNSARFCDALPYLDIVGAMSDATDLPESYRCLFATAELLKNTSKPILVWFTNRASTKFIMKLYEIVAGRKEEVQKYPFGYYLFQPISPLRFPLDGVDVLYETCPYGIPVAVSATALMGATAPATLAGTIVQQNAENLAGICVVQLIQPGIPVVYGGMPHAMDMGTTSMIAAGPEQSLITIAMTQLGKYYGLPVYVDVGISDSKIQDAQAGLEAGITLSCGAMAGADMFGSFGCSGEDQGTSLLMLMIQHELIGFIEHMMKGFEITDEKIGIDVIKKARHEGSFLAEEHTLKHFRKELWFPQLLDRNFWQKWFDVGHKDMRTLCKEKKDEIFKKYNPEPINESTLMNIERLLNDAKKHL